MPGMAKQRAVWIVGEYLIQAHADFESVDVSRILFSALLHSTDPSGIDAEASIKNGAVIVYQDTNNSSKDFHQRKVASLK